MSTGDIDPAGSSSASADAGTAGTGQNREPLPTDDPDSPGAAISRDEDAPASEIPEPNEPG